MHALATQPELYSVFVEAGGPLTIMQLLAHQNSDIFGATAHLLQARLFTFFKNIILFLYYDFYLLAIQIFTTYNYFSSVSMFSFNQEFKAVRSIYFFLLQELTDVELLHESEEGAAELIESLATGKIIELFVTAFDKLDESNKDDADAVQYALSVVENVRFFSLVLIVSKWLAISKVKNFKI